MTPNEIKGCYILDWGATFCYVRGEGAGIDMNKGYEEH